jgi:hypothetical protein
VDLVVVVLLPNQQMQDLVVREILLQFHPFRDIKVDLVDMMVVLVEMTMVAAVAALVEQVIMQEPLTLEEVLDQFLQLVVMVVLAFRLLLLGHQLIHQ